MLLPSLSAMPWHLAHATAEQKAAVEAYPNIDSGSNGDAGSHASTQDLDSTMLLHEAVVILNLHAQVVGTWSSSKLTSLS